MGRPPFWIWHK